MSVLDVIPIPVPVSSNPVGGDQNRPITEPQDVFDGQLIIIVAVILIILIILTVFLVRLIKKRPNNDSDTKSGDQ